MKTKSPAEHLWTLFVVLLMIPVISIAHSFLVATVWGWLAVPLFHLRALTMGQAYALSVVVATLRGSTETKSADKDKTWEPIAKYAFWYAMILLSAWIARHFV